MKQPNENFRALFSASVVVATLLFSGSLPGETDAEKAEKEATPKLLKVVPDGVYANTSDYEYPFYEVTLVGENLDDTGLKIFINDREIHAFPLEDDSQVPPRKLEDAQAKGQATERTLPPKAYREPISDG